MNKQNDNDTDYCKNCSYPLLYPDKPCPKCEPIQEIELIKNDVKENKRTKSPILVGIIVTIANLFLFPSIVYGTTIKGTGFYITYFASSILLVSAIGILYSIIYRELLTIKYFLGFALGIFTPPILLLILIFLYPIIVPAANSPGVGFAMAFAFIAISAYLIICLFDCIILFLSNAISLYFIKNKNKVS